MVSFTFLEVELEEGTKVVFLIAWKWDELLGKEVPWEIKGIGIEGI